MSYGVMKEDERVHRDPVISRVGIEEGEDLMIGCLIHYMIDPREGGGGVSFGQVSFKLV